MGAAIGDILGNVVGGADDSAVVMVVLFLFLGAKVLGDGIGSLLRP